MNPDLIDLVREAAAGDESAVAWLDVMMPDWREAAVLRLHKEQLCYNRLQQIVLFLRLLMANSRWLPNDNVDPLTDLLVAIINLAKRDATRAKQTHLRRDAEEFLEWAKAEFERDREIPTHYRKRNECN